MFPFGNYNVFLGNSLFGFRSFSELATMSSVVESCHFKSVIYLAIAFHLTLQEPLSLLTQSFLQNIARWCGWVISYLSRSSWPLHEYTMRIIVCALLNGTQVYYWHDANVSRSRSLRFFSRAVKSILLCCSLLLARLMGQYCFARCRLSASSVVVCNARGRSTAAGPGEWPLRRPTLHDWTVRLRPVRATSCSSCKVDWFYHYCQAVPDNDSMRICTVRRYDNCITL